MNHRLDSRIQSISYKLKFISKVRLKDPIRQAAIHEEEIKHNWSYAIVAILKNLKLPQYNVDSFNCYLEQYNKENETELKFEDYASLYWVRVVANEIYIARTIQKVLWQVGESGVQSVTQNHHHQQLLTGLLNWDYYRAKRSTISGDKCRQVLIEARTAISIDNFVERKLLLNSDSNNDNYEWRTNGFVETLSDKIGSVLWIELENDKIADKFLRYIRLVSVAEIIPQNLASLLSTSSCKDLSECAYSLLSSEYDLLNSDDEYKKAALDYEHDSGYKLIEKNPNISLGCADAVELLKKLSSRQVFDNYHYQYSRSILYTVIRIVLQTDIDHGNPFAKIIRLVNDTERPFLVASVCDMICDEFSHILPYLIKDVRSIPAVLFLVDKIGINDSALLEDENNRKVEESREYLNEIWFDLYETVIGMDDFFSQEEYWGALAKVVANVAEKVFEDNSNTRYATITHNSLRARYDRAVQRLFRIDYLTKGVHHKLVTHFRDEIEKQYSTTSAERWEYVHINVAYFDLGIKTLQLIDFVKPNKDIDSGVFAEIKEELINLLKNQLVRLFSIREILVYDFYMEEPEIRKVKRSNDEFGYELMDWGYLFLQFSSGDFEEIEKSFIVGLEINGALDSSEYDEDNLDSTEKVKGYLLTTMTAYLSIKSKESVYVLAGFRVSSALQQLEYTISKYAEIHSVTDLPKGRLDAFRNKLHISYAPYRQPLFTILCRCINLFNASFAESFVIKFFSNATDISRMLTAINLLDSIKLRNIVSQKLANVKVEEYIKSAQSMTEIESALIEAVNSDFHWKLAEPLLSKVVQFSEKVQFKQVQYKELIFEISLLLAFKRGSLAQIEQTELPGLAYSSRDFDKINNEKRMFFIALYHLYCDKDYDIAIEQLHSLTILSPKNVNFAFQLYRARTLRSLEYKDLGGLYKGNELWEFFLNAIDSEQRSHLEPLSDFINLTRIHYLAEIRDLSRLDETISRLPNRYLFDAEAIPSVYRSYTSRRYFEKAHIYLIQASNFYSEKGEAKPEIIFNLLNNDEDPTVLTRLKENLEAIASLQPSHIPFVIPNRYNNQKALGEFILNEILISAKLMLEKINAINSIRGEDRYNDILLALMRSRIAFWGWSIHDQSRSGNSPARKNAGETDITLQCGGTTIALFEALVLKKATKGAVIKHLTKISGYNAQLERYYMIVYFNGDNDKFNNIWESYKQYVRDAKYPSVFTFDRGKDFTMLNDKFLDVNNMILAKTQHGDKKDVFHLFINLNV